MIRSILHRVNGSALDDLPRPFLLAFDFDGTIAPIARQPDAAMLPPTTRRLLRQLSRRESVAVLSGRSVADLAPRLSGVGPVTIVGNHGRERPGFKAPGRSVVDRWYRELTRRLAGAAGVVVEHKGFTLAAHWRTARRAHLARAAIARAVAALQPAPRVIAGKRVTNLLPADGIDKGTALAELMREQGARSAVYVGDDDTDEDVFRLAPGIPVVGVRVGRSRDSSAPYRLGCQGEIDRLLRRLLARRRGRS